MDAALPTALKIGYSLLCAIVAPIWLRVYGARNFLWFSDIALFSTAVALWLESALLASMMALAVLVPELVWAASLLARLVGMRLSDLADYMFEAKQPLYVRGLSLAFHVVMPGVLVWMLHVLGYDPRALAAQTALACLVLPLTYALTTPRENVNWVYGVWGGPQRRISPLAYLALLMLLLPLVVYFPTHFALQTLFGRP